VLLEKDEKDQLDPSCEELKSTAMSKGGGECSEYNKKKEG
jgi:hypothetical protein